MTSPAGAGDVVRQRLRDLLLRFPCAVLEGVRWSILCKVFKERYPESFTALQAAPAVARGWLLDLAEFREEGGGDGRLWLRDTAALAPGRDGQLGCWPLLVQCLAEIVRNHGVRQHKHALEVPNEDNCTDGLAGGHDDGEVVGVLLAQLKPLIRRHWDPSFEERAVGFFGDSGNHVNIKKMKHLLAELLKWRSQRLVLSRSSGKRTQIDEVLDQQIVLAVSQKHNDMVLCCPAVGRNVPPSVLPMPTVMRMDALDLPPIPAKLINERPTGSLGPQNGHSGMLHAGSLQARESCGDEARPSLKDKDCCSASALRIETLEKEQRRLRIENAEMKKRQRSESEFLNKEIRRLRIENAELKKRCFVPRGGMGQVTPPAFHMQPMWVPAIMTPPVGMSGTPTSRSSPSHVSFGAQFCNTGSALTGGHSSGTGTPQGSMTPIPTGFCFVPMTQRGAPAVPCQPWPQGAQFVAAMPLGAMSMDAGHGSCSATMSPFSAMSQADRFLPKSLFGSDQGTTSRQSENSGVVSPERPRATGDMAAPGSAPRMHTDDRWVCIPSGIVEQQRAHFESDRWDVEEGEVPTGSIAPSAVPEEDEEDMENEDVEDVAMGFKALPVVSTPDTTPEVVHRDLRPGWSST